MSDIAEVEIEDVSSGYQVLPKDVVSEVGSIKLFNKWYAHTPSQGRENTLLIDII
jgi:hypothetical protein